MTKTISILLFALFQLMLNGQTKNQVIPDSATIIIKNTSKFKFTKFLIGVKGEIISGTNLKAGQSKSFRVPTSGNNVYRITVYLDKKLSDKYDIPPMDYFAQVSDQEITTGTYTYLIDVNKEEGSLNVTLLKTE